VGEFFSQFLAVLIGMYLMILLADMGGKVDQIKKAQIRHGITQCRVWTSFVRTNQIPPMVYVVQTKRC